MSTTNDTPTIYIKCQGSRVLRQEEGEPDVYDVKFNLFVTKWVGKYNGVETPQAMDILTALGMESAEAAQFLVISATDEQLVEAIV